MIRPCFLPGIYDVLLFFCLPKNLSIFARFSSVRYDLIMSERDKFEYSQAHEEAEEAKQGVAEIEAQLVDMRKELDELKKERERIIEDNKFAAAHGYAMIDIEKFDLHVTWVKEAILKTEDLKSKLESHAIQLAEADKEMKDLLLKLKIDSEKM